MKDLGMMHIENKYWWVKKKVKWQKKIWISKFLDLKYGNIFQLLVLKVSKMKMIKVFIKFTVKLLKKLNMKNIRLGNIVMNRMVITLSSQDSETLLTVPKKLKISIINGILLQVSNPLLSLMNIIQMKQ